MLLIHPSSPDGQRLSLGAVELQYSLRAILSELLPDNSPISLNMDGSASFARGYQVASICAFSAPK